MIARFIEKEPLIWGPIFLIFSVAMAAPFGIPYDLLLLSVAGFFLSARMEIRGCAYALVLLGLSSLLRHAFFLEEHLWTLGIEISLAIAFFVTALSFEAAAGWIHSLHSQIETRKAVLDNLEEELVKTKEMAQEQQIVFQEKVALLQKELEELQAEHSSILILNEVLRKTSARHLKEMQEAKAEIGRPQVISELNQIRDDKERIQRINETLASLHLREQLKAKDAESEAASLKEQLRAAHQIIRNIEKNKVDPEIAERVKFAEEKMLHLSQMEPLLRQLKKQFEEKNQILHETRAALFKSDTELQGLRIEKAALDLNPLPKEIEKELESLSYQIELLEEENRELQELITVLNQTSSGKKK